MKRYVTLKIILVLLFFIPKATYAQIPDPVITATGNQVYCPGTSLSVVQTVSITPDILDPSTTTDAPVYIQIATGYVAGVGKDILTYVGSNPAITATWSESEAKLTLSPSPLAPGGKVLYTDLETAIKNVQFSNPAATPGKRDFSIILGVGNRKLSYLPRNKHYYEYFADPAVTWASANIKAQTKSYYGMQGYLVTITKADEQQVAGNQAPGTGWIGASDATKEGDWKWVTGPEGLANAGAGTLFFQGQGIGGLNIFFTEIGETVPTKFSFWQNGEPNNSNGGTEDYAQIVDPILSGKQGLWNDLNGNNVIGGGSPLYISKGYIVEYGGMPGDPVVVNKATTTMTIPDVIFYPKKTATICAGNTATFTANVLAGTTVYWYDSSGTLLQNDPLKPNFTTPILNANPTIFYSDNGCVSTRQTFTVTVNPNILPTFNAIPAICANASAPVLPSSSTNGFTGTWSPAIVSNTATGTYTFTPNAGQCATTALLTVTVNPNILPTFNAIPAICTNATAPVLPSSSTNGFTGTWNPAIVSNTATGTYTFTPDAGQCATTASVTVTVGSNILPTFNAIPAICTNASAPVLPSSSTNGFTGTWSPAIVSNTATGTYTFTPDAGQCATTASLTVTVNPNILPTFNAIPAICANATAPVLPSSSINGFTGTWSPAIVSNTATGTYTFTPDVGQCATTASLTVTVNPNILPTFSVIPAICANSTAPVLPSSSTNGFTGTWNPAIVSNTATGTYIFTPDAGQCATTASLTVTVNPNILPTFNAIPAICANASAPVLPSSSTNGFTGTWNPAIVSNTATGTYTFTPNAGQCATTASLTVTVNPNILPTFNAIPAICANATAPVLPSSSTNGFTGTWNPAIVSNTATGTYIFTPNAGGQCVTTASLTVTVNPNVLPTFNAIPAICANAIAPVLPSSSTNGFTGTWSPVVVSNTATGTYIFTPNAGQCATTATLTVTVNPNIIPTFNAIPAICANSTVPVLPSSSTNGFIGTWSPATVSNTATGTYTFTPSAGQCATTALLTVTVNPSILPTFNAIPAICANATAPVLPSSSTNGFTGTWSPAIVSNTATGTYTFTPNAGQCATIASLTVTVDPLPNINLNENKISCSDTPISFTLDAGIQDGSSPNNYTYIWTKDGSVLPDTTPTLDVTVIGVYTVEVTSASGCSQIRTITVNTSKSPIIDSVVVVDLTDVNTITINLKEPGDFQYSLDDSSGYWQDSNVFSNVSGGIHTVYVSDKFGCPSVSKTPITVIGAPKFFTPNNDAYNDYWKVKGLNADDSKSVIYIYDRYGKLLKQWIPAVNQLGWDGTLNGMPLPADDYWYTLKLENGREAKGHFSLKR
jgi:gliding motility-associated-like protein